jgi:hypothetical protein
MMNTKQNTLIITALIMLLVGVITASAAAAPTISSISPTYGPASESVKVTILGTGFTSTSHVWFDGQDLTAAGFTTFVNSGKITVNKYIAPQPQPKTVSVSVWNGGSSSNFDKTFTYVGKPVISNVNPNNGPISGGNTVKITGSSFLGTTSVKFGTKAATSFTIDSDNQITAVVPQGVNLGFVDVTITNSVKKNNGNMITLTSDPAKKAYEYYQGPVIYSVVSNQGPVAGGNEVIINGAGFTPGYLEDDGVMFGDINADINRDPLKTNDHMITVTVPGITSKQSDKPKAVDVKVTINGITVVKSQAYTYIVNPYITGISPDVGKLDGGNKVTLTGYGFTGIKEVRFIDANGAVYETYTDDEISTNVKFVNDRNLKVTFPPGYNAAGFTAKVQVVSDGGVSPVSTAVYQYQQLPIISSMVPSQGPAGTTVTLTLKGQYAGVPLLPVQKVMFGNVEATFVTVDSQKITAVAPPQAAGTKVAVKLVTAGGSSTNNPKFTYK